MFEDCKSKSFKKSERFIEQSIDSRIDDLSNDYLETVQCITTDKEREVLFQKLKRKLSKEDLSLLIKYDDLYSKIISSYQNYFYRQGFLDCRLIFNFFICRNSKREVNHLWKKVSGLK